MNAPIKPRYTYVHHQLETLEDELSRMLPVILLFETNVGYWHDMDELTDEDNHRIAQYILHEFDWLKRSYEGSKDVTDIIDQSVILIQNCIWVSMNNQFPNHDLGLYTDRISENIVNVYNQIVCPRLRNVMIAANHNCEVIQRVWRRCNTDPSHPMCRRRLDYEFEQDLNALRA
jgi:hypothetical protein